jgi:hypothetical protein
VQLKRVESMDNIPVETSSGAGPRFGFGGWGGDPSNQESPRDGSATGSLTGSFSAPQTPHSPYGGPAHSSKDAGGTIGARKSLSNSRIEVSPRRHAQAAPRSPAFALSFVSPPPLSVPHHSPPVACPPPPLPCPTWLRS